APSYLRASMPANARCPSSRVIAVASRCPEITLRSRTCACFMGLFWAVHALTRIVVAGRAAACGALRSGRPHAGAAIARHANTGTTARARRKLMVMLLLPVQMIRARRRGDKAEPLD